MKTKPCYLKTWDTSADRILVIEQVSKAESREPNGPYAHITIETSGGWKDIEPKTALELGEFLVAWAKENA